MMRKRQKANEQNSHIGILLFNQSKLFLEVILKGLPILQVVLILVVAVVVANKKNYK